MAPSIPVPATQQSNYCIAPLYSVVMWPFGTTTRCHSESSPQQEFAGTAGSGPRPETNNHPFTHSTVCHAKAQHGHCGQCKPAGLSSAGNADLLPVSAMRSRSSVHYSIWRIVHQHIVLQPRTTLLPDCHHQQSNPVTLPAMRTKRDHAATVAK